MAKVKTQCHICGKTMKDKVPSAECSQCGADLVNPEFEVLKKFEYCNYTGQGRSGKHGGAGLLILTDQRFAFIKNAEPEKDILDPFYSPFAKRTGIVVSIPPNEIQSFSTGKVAFIKVMVITAKDGTEYKFNIDKNEYDQWREALLPENFTDN